MPILFKSIENKIGLRLLNEESTSFMFWKENISTMSNVSLHPGSQSRY